MEAARIGVEEFGSPVEEHEVPWKVHGIPQKSVQSLGSVWKLKEWKGHSERVWIGKLGAWKKWKGVGRFVVPTIKWTTEAWVHSL